MNPPSQSKSKMSKQGLFARRLASNSKKERYRALKSMRGFLQHQEDMDGMDMLKLWQGLYVTMWFSDKPAVQLDLAERLGIMVHYLPQDVAITYFKSFFHVLQQKWAKIDRLRLDKYLTLVRKMMDNLFVFIARGTAMGNEGFPLNEKRRKFLLLAENGADDTVFDGVQWDPSRLEILKEILCHVESDNKRAGPFSGFKTYPRDVIMQLLDVYVPSACLIGQFHSLDSKVMIGLLEPVFQLAINTDDKLILKRMKEAVFVHMGKDYDEGLKEQLWVQSMKDKQQSEEGLTQEEQEVLEEAQQQFQYHVPIEPDMLQAHITSLSSQKHRRAKDKQKLMQLNKAFRAVGAKRQNIAKIQERLAFLDDDDDDEQGTEDEQEEDEQPAKARKGKKQQKGSTRKGKKGKKIVEHDDDDDDDDDDEVMVNVTPKKSSSKGSKMKRLMELSEQKGKKNKKKTVDMEMDEEQEQTTPKKGKKGKKDKKRKMMEEMENDDNSNDDGDVDEASFQSPEPSRTKGGKKRRITPKSMSSEEAESERKSGSSKKKKQKKSKTMEVEQSSAEMSPSAETGAAMSNPMTPSKTVSFGKVKVRRFRKEALISTEVQHQPDKTPEKGVLAVKTYVPKGRSSKKKKKKDRRSFDFSQ
eukprot:TRINITY_DN624_c0_g3_i3.p1 TRINITY_DN624_c0_g3~~TRINITY_DN624_c0_g3_i3.p1  ORF type:complete len:639 (+),score=290.87 TRINITY_DN624_c0_g3_i3:1228-3144(+)